MEERTGASGDVAGVPIRSRVILAMIIVSFLLLRGPVLYRQIPAQDEDYFAVPGYTILHEGVPRIPYMPSEDPGSAFYRADRMLFALPPLYFYWQAAVYAVLGPSTGNARLASTLAGMAVVVVVYLLAKQWFRDEAAALWGAGLYAFSRIAYFPCMLARPDMVCALLGLIAVGCAGRWSTTGKRRWLAASGAAIGLGLLTHPFALIFALQIGVWTLLAGRSLVERLGLAAMTAGVAALGFALWLPLIAMEPEIFQRQFGNNVFHRSGPGLVRRMLFPWESIRAQAVLLLEHTGPIQLALLTIGLLFVTGLALRERKGWPAVAAALAWSGVYLHVACQGTHPAKGYWCYTAAPLWIFVGLAVARLIASLQNKGTFGRATGVGVGVLTALLMTPGSGLRTLAAHCRHWNDVNYNAPEFTRRLMESLPAEGQFVVDPGYVFDFYRAGRDVKLALIFPFFYDVSHESYDNLVAGPYSLRDGVPKPLEAKFERSFGDREDLFACYAEVYSAPAHRRPGGAP